MYNIKMNNNLLVAFVIIIIIVSRRRIIVARLVEFKRCERFAVVLILPLSARLALNRATPLESAVARLRDEHAPGVVTAAAAKQIASVNTL